jgi:hypothetical protein
VLRDKRLPNRATGRTPIPSRRWSPRAGNSPTWARTCDRGRVRRGGRERPGDRRRVLRRRGLQPRGRRPEHLRGRERGPLGPGLGRPVRHLDARLEQTVTALGPRSAVSAPVPRSRRSIRPGSSAGGEPRVNAHRDNTSPHARENARFLRVGWGGIGTV